MARLKKKKWEDGVMPIEDVCTPSGKGDCKWVIFCERCGKATACKKGVDITLFEYEGYDSCKLYKEYKG